jgi:hypothetical protein
MSPELDIIQLINKAATQESFREKLLSSDSKEKIRALIDFQIQTNCHFSKREIIELFFIEADSIEKFVQTCLDKKLIKQSSSDTLQQPRST